MSLRQTCHPSFEDKYISQKDNKCKLNLLGRLYNEVEQLIKK